MLLPLHQTVILLEKLSFQLDEQTLPLLLDFGTAFYMCMGRVAPSEVTAEESLAALVSARATAVVGPSGRLWDAMAAATSFEAVRVAGIGVLQHVPAATRAAAEQPRALGHVSTCKHLRRILPLP